MATEKQPPTELVELHFLAGPDGSEFAVGFTPDGRWFRFDYPTAADDEGDDE